MIANSANVPISAENFAALIAGLESWHLLPGVRLNAKALHLETAVANRSVSCEDPSGKKAAERAHLCYGAPLFNLLIALVALAFQH